MGPVRPSRARTRPATVGETGRDPRTGAVRCLPVPGVTIAWTADGPGGAEVRTTGPGPDALSRDPATGFLLFPLSRARAAAIEAAAAPIATRIRALMPDGSPVPYLTGTIALEDPDGRHAL